VKYLTKEWYWKRQHQIFFDLKIEPRAKEFSEALYRELFEIEEKKWLDEYIEWNHWDGKMDHPAVVIALEVRRKDFRKRQEIDLRRARRVLSEELLSDIADLRVFQLGYVTKEVADKIEQYISFCNRESKSIQEAFELTRKIVKEKNPVWLDEFDFHDAKLRGAQMYGSDLFITLRPITFPKRERAVVFKNAKIIKQDDSLNASIWLYEEFYPINGGWEIHVLLWKDWEVNDLIITCDDVQYIDMDEMNAMQYSLRKAIPADLPRIQALFAEMMRAIDPAAPAAGYAPEDVAYYFSGGGDWICVAEAEGQVVGFLAIELHREELEYLYLDDFSVTASCRGKGIGTAMMVAAEEYARKCGVGLIVLHVKMTNIGAKRLYENYGFAVLDNDGDRYRMVKDI